MPSDQEYLANAGITPEGSNIEQIAPASPATDVAQATTPEEYFEITHQNQKLKLPTNYEFQLTHDGKAQKVPYSKLVNTYRQAAHLEDKFKDFNTQKSEFQKQQGDYGKYKEFYSKYEPLQTWSEKNPEEFQTIWDMYQNKSKHLMQNQVAQQAPDEMGKFQPFIEKITNLEKQLGEMSEFKSSWQKEREDAQTQADVQEVESEITKFKQDFKEINLDERDAEGTALWAKIVAHGVDRKIPSFRAAALEYLEPKLFEVVQLRARNDAVRQVKDKARAGIVATSEKPMTSGNTLQFDPRRASYDQIAEQMKTRYAELSAQGT